MADGKSWVHFAFKTGYSFQVEHCRQLALVVKSTGPSSLALKLTVKFPLAAARTGLCAFLLLKPSGKESVIPQINAAQWKSPAGQAGFLSDVAFPFKEEVERARFVVGDLFQAFLSRTADLLWNCTLAPVPRAVQTARWFFTCAPSGLGACVLRDLGPDR